MLSIVLAACSLSLSPGTAGAGPEDPPLSQNEAWLYAFDALEAEFGNSLLNGDAVGMHCSKKVARNIRRCRPSWFIGDISYSGRLYVAYQRRKATGRVKAVVDGKINWLNGFCAATGGTRDDCSKKFKVHRSSRAKYL